MYPVTADFLRDLMHSDGCRVNNWTRCVVAGEMKRYDYPRWQFVNHSEDPAVVLPRSGPAGDPVASVELEDHLGVDAFRRGHAGRAGRAQDMTAQLGRR